MTHRSRGSVRHTLLVVLATVGALTIFTFTGCAALVGFGISSITKSVQSTVTPNRSTSFSDNNVVFAIPNKNTPYIAGIKFEEPITGAFADSIISKLRYAQKDPNAIGILLEVNSPGGVVVPSQDLYDAVAEVAKVKPIVAFVRTMAASGAYYTIAPASKIVASRGSIIGSIGVIMQSFEVDELLKFLKVEPVTIKTGKLKDAGSPLRQMTPEDKSYLNNLITQMFDTFVEDVRKARPALTYKDLQFMSDGRVVLAPQAKNLNLIDAVGSKESAKNEIGKLANTKNVPNVFYYADIKPFSDIFTEKFVSSSSNALKDIFVHQKNLPNF